MNLIRTSTKRVYLSFIFALLVWGKAWSQDPQFTQFYANPVYINPAFAGTSNVGRIVINTRSQWSSISGAFNTGSFSYDEHFKSIKGGIAIQAVYDEQGVGVLRTSSVNFAYSSEIPVTRYFTIRAALQAGFFQKSIDFSKLLWYDQIAQNGFILQTNESPGNSSITSANFAAGVLGYSKNFYAGFAVHNLFEPQQSFFQGLANPIPRRYTANMGLVIPLNGVQKNEKLQMNLYPNVLVKSQRQFNQINLGLYMSRGPYVAGVYFRQNSINADALIFILGIRTQKVKAGYSYDATVSQAKTGAPTSHEVSLAFELKKRNPRVKPRRVVCPGF